MTGQIGAQERGRRGVRAEGEEKRKKNARDVAMRMEKDIAPDQTAIYRPLFAPSCALSFRLPVRSNFSRKQMISKLSLLLHLRVLLE